MAIYSLNHSCVGKSTHKAGTAAAHIKYISRESAASVILAEHIPANSRAARKWINEEETNSRSNARVIDKIMVALPIELNTNQRIELIKNYMKALTNGECPWYASIHQKGKDQHNPHCHIVIRDKSVLTGRRVVRFSDMGSTNRIREHWAVEASNALKRAGYDITLDHRSYREQGIDKIPGQHLGWKHHAEQRQLNQQKGKQKQFSQSFTKPIKRREEPIYLMDHWMPVTNNNHENIWEQQQAYSPLVPEP